jgi:hypothetical protein
MLFGMFSGSSQKSNNKTHLPIAMNKAKYLICPSYHTLLHDKKIAKFTISVKGKAEAPILPSP